MRRVVITGMGVVSLLGNTIDAFWHGLVSGRSAAKSLKDITHCVVALARTGENIPLNWRV